MIIVYSSKPLGSQCIAPQLLEKYPNQKIVYIHSMYFTNVVFDYPRNLKWKDFPYITTPVFKVSSVPNWKTTTLINDKLEPIDISFSDVMKCDKIIYAADPSATDSYLFSEFIKVILNKKIELINIDMIFINSFLKDNIRKSIENMSNFTESFQERVNYGKIKKYFDYNFNFNSFALLGKVYKEISEIFNDEKNLTNDYGNIFISKNMLQLLYFVRKQQNNNINYREGSLIGEMINWKGTGKYQFKSNVGNEASRTSIIKNLLVLKLLNYKGKNIIITEKGKTFLEYLPKDCQDSDLPFRIALWAKEPFEESKIKIDNYLHSYFKKIKNKLK